MVSQSRENSVCPPTKKQKKRAKTKRRVARRAENEQRRKQGAEFRERKERTWAKNGKGMMGGTKIPEKHAKNGFAQDPVQSRFHL